MPITREDAIIIANAISVADGGCRHCVRDICEKLNAAGWPWRFEIVESDDPENVVRDDEPWGGYVPISVRQRAGA